MLKKRIEKYLKEIKELSANPTAESAMPKNTYFMANGDVLCTERKCGESRFPYPNDGYILWAHSTGHIHAKTGIFNVFKPIFDSNEPAVEFFAGIKNEDGTYFPISILGAAKQLFELYNPKRYLVYTLGAAYYITDTDIATFAVRATMSRNDEIIFSLECINKGNEPIELAVTSYFDPLLANSESDTMWTYKARKAVHLGDGSFIMSRGKGKSFSGLCVSRRVSGAEIKSSAATVCRQAFLGSQRAPITCAESLKTGCFDNTILLDGGAISSEIIKLTLDKECRIDYVLPLTKEENKAKALATASISPDAIDASVEAFETSETDRLNNLDIKLGGFSNDGPNENIFNQMVKKVQKQVDNCAMGKYYVENLMGIRDVYQQLEQALLWDPKQAREKMLRALSFLDPSGRAPRQFSLPEYEGAMPKMDLRAFIDQGNWIISCFYSYLAWTGDYSILNEEIGYYEILDDKNVRLSALRDSALTHLIKIVGYLESNLDKEEGTNCLKILFGDWNDALDGLGHTNDEGKRYGTGVSVMASLHFYQNLKEMSEILEKVGGYDELSKHCLDVRKMLGDGLIKNAIVENDKGDKRLIHGWGDHISYKIGSFSDSDGVSRISFAPNAFWVSSGLIRETPELKELIINSLHSLDSKFGLKTLTPAFTPDTPGVGRIAVTPPGTAENDCVYVHATMFSILSLFALGDCEFAWDSLCKVVPISQKQMTRTPFVMSNSYLDNPDLNLYGQSPIDWYTGSGTVLIKNVVRYVLGVGANLDGVTISTPKKSPCKSMRATLTLKGVKVHFEYESTGAGERKFYLDGKEISSEFDAIIDTKRAFIGNADIHEGAVIKVTD